MSAPRPAVVESYSNGFWTVRYGPGVTEIENLRSWQFRFAATNPQYAPPSTMRRSIAAPDTLRLDGRAIWPGQKVELRYEVGSRSGLWFAYPEVQS